jgi:hypothetical protein
MVGMPDYYAHQHSQNQSTDSNVVRLSSLYTVVGGSGGVEHANGDIQLAVGNQLAAYKPPARRGKDSPGRALCASEDCKAYPMKEIEHCSGHARSLGLVESWSTKKKAVVDGDAG